MAGRKKAAPKGGAGAAESTDTFDNFMSDNEIPTLEKMEKQQEKYKTYSTGSFMLDIAIGERDCDTGRPGIPERAIVEIFGSNGSCKTATAENLLKNVLAADPNNRAVCIWAEEPDVDRLLGYGIDKNRVASIYAYQDGPMELQLAEKHLELAKNASKYPEVKLVIIDSIKALCSNKQMFKDGKALDLETAEGMAIRANMMTRFLMGFKQMNRNAILFMTNQTSDRIQTPNGPYIDNPRYNIHTPGGRGKEFECSLRIKASASPIESSVLHSMVNEKLVIGWNICYKLIKNKYANNSASRTAFSEFMLNPAGFRRETEILACADYLGLVEKGGGGHYKIGDRTIRGSAAVIKTLIEDQELTNSLENLILDRMNEVYVIHEEPDPVQEALG